MPANSAPEQYTRSSSLNDISLLCFMTLFFIQYSTINNNTFRSHWVASIILSHNPLNESNLNYSHHTVVLAFHQYVLATLNGQILKFPPPRMKAVITRFANFFAGQYYSYCCSPRLVLLFNIAFRLLFHPPLPHLSQTTSSV